MLNRRTFLAASGVAGLASMAGSAVAAGPASQGGRDYFQLQQYQVETEAQKARLDAYLRDAAIPALNRLGVQPVGVFCPLEGLGPVWVLLRHKSPEVLLTLVERLMADEQFQRKGADALAATAPSPAFKRLESSMLLAFQGMPELAPPAKTPGRIFQLRIYESPSVKTGRKKIEMFNSAGELPLFRRVGLNPVFFGETLVGPKMPNLTYMLAFAGRKEQEDAWKRFRVDPEWLRLKGMAEYADKTILCGITNLLLKPADYSQM